MARLYSAAFARAPDAAGLSVQLDTLHLGVTPVQLSQNFLASAEFTARYGTNQTDNAYVTTLYSNVLGRVPDGGGFAVQMDALAHGLSRAQLLLNFGESAENQTKSQPTGCWSNPSVARSIFRPQIYGIVREI